jgi:hypothetical protein
MHVVNDNVVNVADKTTFHISGKVNRHKQQTNKLRGLSPQANYIDRANLVPTLADRGCRVVSATDPHGCILGFLDRSRYYFFQVAPELYSRG